jgi:hypothetical protein
MWEVFTGGTAFAGAHYGEVFEAVVLRDARPPLPPGMPEPYALLMTRCWATDPAERPSFESVLRCIHLMLHQLRAERGEPQSSGGAAGTGGSGSGALARGSAGAGSAAAASALASSADLQDL